MNQNNIRKIKINEIDIILDIWYNSNIDTYTFINKEYFNDIKSNVKNKFMKYYNNIYVYEENNNILAFCLIENDYIDELYVKFNYRNQGIGTKILNYLKERNQTLTLNIFKKNEKGISFYQKNNFKIIEENIEDLTQKEGFFMKWTKTNQNNF